jgi:hypothetical protein
MTDLPALNWGTPPPVTKGGDMLTDDHYMWCSPWRDDLSERWADVESDPDLVLDMTDGGFHWQPHELSEVVALAMACLQEGGMLDEETMPEFERRAGLTEGAGHEGKGL